MCAVVIDTIVTTIQGLAILVVQFSTTADLLGVIIQGLTAAISGITRDGHNLSITASLLVVIIYTCISAAVSSASRCFSVDLATTANLGVVVVCR